MRHRVLALVVLPSCFDPATPMLGPELGSTGTVQTSFDQTATGDPSTDATSSPESSDATTSDDDASSTSTSTSTAATTNASEESSAGTTGDDPCGAAVCGTIGALDCGTCDVGDCIDHVLCCTAPAEIAVIDTPGEAVDVFVDDDWMYVADYGEGFRVYDISDLDSPIETDSLTPGSYAWDVEVAGGRAYVAWAYFGVRVIDVSSPGALVELGVADTAVGTGVALAGNHAYLAGGGTAVLGVVDVSDAASPVLVGSAPLPGQAINVDVANEYAFIGVESGVVVAIDVTSPADPDQSGVYASKGSPLDVVVDGSIAYVATAGHGLEVLDVADPDALGLLGELELDGVVGQLAGIDVAGDLVAIAHGGATTFVDVADPSAPLALGTIATPGIGIATGVFLHDDAAFIGAGTAGVQVVALPVCNR